MPKPFKLSGKRTVTGQNSGELYKKSTDEAIPDFPGRIFQVKGQSKKVI